MRKRFFDVGLYLDGLKQLRIIGVMLFTILELEAVLVPMGKYIKILQYQELGGLDVIGNQGTISFLDMHPLLVLAFTIFAPVMVLYLFSFLNKRGSSDFYHSLPNTRLSLFFSFFAAVITWVAAACILSSLTSVAGHLMLYQYYTINFTSVWIMLFNMLAASLYTAAAVAIGMCLSGTTFTNLVVSLLLIFMPRVLLLILTSYLSSALSILSPEHFMPPLDSAYNVATNLVLGVVTGGMERSFTSVTGGVYTLGLGMVYTVLAAILFRKRKSEAAGQSAPNRALQTVYRCLLAFVVCLIPIVSIVDGIINQDTPNGQDIFMYLVLYLIAVLVYLIYEIITTRKWHNLLRSLPGLGILGLCNLALIGGMLGAYHSVLSFQPDKDEIAYVRLLSDGSLSNNNYFSLKATEARLDDPAILEMVANRLRFQVEEIKKYPGARSGDYQTVAIHTGLRTVYRRLSFSSEDQMILAESFADNEEIRRAYTVLPQLGQNATSVGVSGLSSEQSKEIYKVFQEEAAAMDFTDWYTYIQKYTQAGVYKYGYAQEDTWYRDGYPATLHISTSVGASSAYLRLPLTDQFPKSANLYLQYANAGNDSAQTIRQLMNREWQASDSLQLCAYNLSKDIQGTVHLVYHYYGDEVALMQADIQALAEALMESVDQPAVIDKPLLYVNLQLRPYDENGSEYQGWINVPDEAVPLLLTVMSGPYETHSPTA